ncbi:MAG: hypothetical protein WBA70_13465, partial [Thermodesulfobacteriota bacterium]
MTTESTENLLIESKFETLISKSKLYIKNRNEEELISLNEDIEDLKAKVSSSLENNASGHNINYLTSLKLLLSILEKFTSSVVLMERMKSKKPLYEQFDT